ncbi:Reticulocyte-binding protein 2 like a, partial [Dissostichus eleginoides]
GEEQEEQGGEEGEEQEGEEGEEGEEQEEQGGEEQEGEGGEEGEEGEEQEEQGGEEQEGEGGEEGEEQEGRGERRERRERSRRERGERRERRERINHVRPVLIMNADTNQLSLVSYRTGFLFPLMDPLSLQQFGLLISEVKSAGGAAEGTTLDVERQSRAENIPEGHGITTKDFSQQHFPLEDSNRSQAVLQREKPSSHLPPSEVASHTAIYKDGQHTSGDARQAFGDLRGESDPLKSSRETEEKFFISASET